MTKHAVPDRENLRTNTEIPPLAATDFADRPHLGSSLSAIAETATAILLRGVRSLLKEPLEKAMPTPIFSSLDLSARAGGFGTLKKIGVWVLGLVIWYSATGKEKPAQTSQVKQVSKIEVLTSTLPTETNSAVEADERAGSSKTLDLSKVDLSQDFEIVTKRYKVIKHEDSAITRPVGHVISCIGKLFFWDRQIGAGLDADGTRRVLSMLEANKEINGLTVRINHNEVFEDTFRLFIDEEVKDRNNIVARVAVGVPTTFLGEFFSELRRGDYYNPMTQTAVIYSDVTCIAGHEIGHHQDFQRFGSDWGYALSRALPPVMLYQEWQASRNAKTLMSPEEDWQYARYLIPAFATYILAAYSLSRKMLTKTAQKENPFASASDITPTQVLRYMLTKNADLFAGIAMYSALSAAKLPEVIKSVGFGGAWIATDALLNRVLKEVIPYDHE